MSHFTVAVIHRDNQDIDDLLEKYSENIQVEKYLSHTKEEAIAYVRTYFSEQVKDKDDEECYAILAEGYDDDMRDEDGNLYSTYNPDSKWDWYVIGGRWGGLLRLKDRSFADEARIGDINFSPDAEEYEKALRFWDVVVEHEDPRDGENFSTSYREDYLRKQYRDREDYATQSSSFSTFAVVTPDGEWHEKGQMGWFACSDETPDEARKWNNSYLDTFISNADPDLIITIVDCHI